MTDKQESQWVHDDGYGSPAFGGVIIGLFWMLFGIISGIVSLISRIKK